MAWLMHQNIGHGKSWIMRRNIGGCCLKVSIASALKDINHLQSGVRLLAIKNSGSVHMYEHHTHIKESQFRIDT